MIDTKTRMALQVSTDGSAGPYVIVSLTKLDKVTSLLDANKIRYWVDEEAISLDGAPEIAIINLAQDSNSVLVQSLLDSIS